jgi:flagellar motility protein MotE (MotC chaperone)
MRLRLLPVVILAAVLLLGETVWLVVSGRQSAVPAEAPRVVTDVDPTFRPVVAAGDPAPPAIDPHAAYAGGLVPPIDPVVTGSIGTGGDKAAAKVAPPKTEPAPEASDSATAAAASAKSPGLADSPAERKLLDDLHQRRDTLDAQAKALDLRENLMAAAQKRLDQRIAELKALGLSADAEAPGGTPAPGSPAEKRLDNLVAVYAAMRAKDAAKIFDTLDMSVLEQIARRMKPRVFSDIRGLMDTKTADRLTLLLAGHGSRGAAPAAIDSLPKIEGHPTVQ